MKDRIDQLETIHDEHTILQKQFRDEVASLEKKYQGLYAPLYEKVH